MKDLSTGDLVDGWLLGKALGRGGNARVWKATRDRETVALKILHRFETRSEPFQRFRAEISVLRQLGYHPGILPLLDASLPDAPTRDHPAWLAMPIATPIRESLGAEPEVKEIISAHQTFAATLADLEERHGIFHRDLKPQNLYSYDGRACLGDFGLVSYPDMASLTAPGRWLGPAQYLAPEMLANPGGALPGPVDVFALAKTLWTLLTRSGVPIPGPLDRRFDAVRLTNHIQDDRLYLIEALLESATRHDPEARPTMREFSDELRSWARVPTDTAPLFDAAALRLRVVPRVTQHLAMREAADKLVEDSEKMMKLVASRLPKLEATLHDVLGLDVGTFGANAVTNLLSLHRFFEQPGHRTYRASAMSILSIPPFDGGGRVQLVGGVALFIGSNVERVGLGAAWGVFDIHGAAREVWGSGDYVISGSARASALCEELLDGLYDNAERAVLAFVETIP